MKKKKINPIKQRAITLGEYALTLAIMLTLLIGGIALSASSIFPYQGGTGTSTVPTVGQMLMSEVAGVYAPTAVIGLGDELPDAVLEVTTSADSGALFAFFMVSTVSTQDGDVFIINTDSEVGISDVTPDAVLEVTTNSTNAGSDFFYISSAEGTDGDIFAVDDEGNIGIGDSSPDGNLDVYLNQNLTEAGAVCITSGNVFSDETDGSCDSSSIKVKTDVTKLTYGLDEVLRMNSVFFRYKKDFKPSFQYLRAGFIAEEMFEVAPEVVTYDLDGEPDGIDYGRITSITVNAIKEQQEMIENIEVGDPSGLIKGLEARIELLEAKIDELETETVGQTWWDKLVEYFSK